MKISYPVLFYEEKDKQYSAFVPDFNNVSTCGSSLDEAIDMTKDLVLGLLTDYVVENNEIPNASKLKIYHSKN